MTVKYTRDLLSRTAAESSSVNDMMRRLGVPLAGGTHSYLSKRLKHYGIDTAHFNQGRPDYGRRRYPRELLADAAANSTSIGGMLEYLGIRPYDSIYWHFKRQLAKFDIDTSHFTFRGEAPGGERLIPRDALADAVANSASIISVLRSLALADNGTSRRKVKEAIAFFGLDTGHFTGQAHNRGRRTGPRCKPDDLLQRRPAGSHRVPGDRLRVMLMHIGRPEHCESCGTPPSWLGRPMTLEVDHINGDWLDNRSENLRLLCPNCHSVTPTYCGRNRNRNAITHA